MNHGIGHSDSEVPTKNALVDDNKCDMVEEISGLLKGARDHDKEVTGLKTFSSQEQKLLNKSLNLLMDTPPRRREQKPLNERFSPRFSPYFSQCTTPNESDDDDNDDDNHFKNNLFIPKLKRKKSSSKELSHEETGEGIDDKALSIQKEEYMPFSPARVFANRPSPRPEQPHIFREHTYRALTHCDICNGLLVGFWSQGLQCGICGFNVHRGEGIGEHDDCRAEGLLRKCPGRSVCCEVKKPARLMENFSKIRHLFKTSPNLVQNVKKQVDRDLKAHAKAAVVAVAVEGQRSKKLRRLKAWIVQFLQHLDNLETVGMSHAVLLSFHVLLTGATAVISFPTFLVALWPQHGLATITSIRLTITHIATVNSALHTLLLILAFLFSCVGQLFKRKAIIVDSLLREGFGIKAEDDLGVSVSGAAFRTRAWGVRTFRVAAFLWSVSVVMWHLAQPPLLDKFEAHYSASKVQVTCSEIPLTDQCERLKQH